MELLLKNTSRFTTLPKWAKLDPYEISPQNPYTLANILDGQIIKSKKTEPIIDPLNGGNFLYNSLP